MKAERIKGLCEIRTALLEVINIQSHEYDPVDLQKVQDTLNQVYDRFVAKYGAINSKGNILAFSDDDQFPLLRSIEDERKDKTGWDKSAIFTKATIRPFRQVNHADTAEDALQICLNHKLRVDLPYMSFLTGKPHRSWCKSWILASISIPRNTTVIRWKDGNLQKNISVVMCGINCSTHVRRQRKNRNSLPGM